MIPVLRRPAVSWPLAAAASLWLRSFFPTHVIATAIMDDALFVRLARSIASGHWLGPFDSLTLVKGAFYPIFIAASFSAGIPLKLAEHAVYLAASALLAALIPARAPATALFVALAFVPVLWTPELARVIREGLYIGLSLATFAAAASIATAPTPRSAAWRGFGLGLVAGAFWLTREEGVWLLPALLVVLALGAWRTGWRSLPRPLAAALLGWGILVGGNVAHNWSSYRVAKTVDVRSSAFQHAYGALSRIQQPWQHYVVFPAAARALAFRVSPAARELRPFFDGPGGDAWRQLGCRELPGHDCAEILSPWFQWALRDAVQQAGHYATAREAERFYKALAQEIDAACDTTQIPCLPPRATLTAPFRWSDLVDALGPAWSLVTLAATLGGTQVDQVPSRGSLSDIESVADVVGPVARAPIALTDILGRIATPNITPLLRVQPTPGSTVPAWTTTVAFEPPTGFTLSTDCPPSACVLIVSLGDQDVATLPLAALPSHLQTPQLTLDITRLRPLTLHRDTWRRGQAGLALTRAIGAVYTLLGPVLLLAGIAGLALTILRRRDLIRTPLFALVLGSLVAAASRIALLAYVDVTAIPSVNLLYLSPAIPFVIVVCIGGPALLLAGRHPHAV